MQRPGDRVGANDVVGDLLRLETLRDPEDRQVRHLQPAVREKRPGQPEKEFRWSPPRSPLLDPGMCHCAERR
ncbi:MAG TPA: hypothetical protein VGF67_32805 [Ktedonobacteraceae bacterium]